MRFEKQELFKGIGKKGQSLIARAHIAIIGCGALGSGAAELLTRAGVKKVTLIDRDFIELSNLQRQSLYTEKDVGSLKALVLGDRLKEINSSLQVDAHPIDIDVENIDVVRADLVLDCTDNFYTRFVINEFCKKNNVTWIFASAVGAAGYVFPITPKTPCFRCLFNEPTGVLGSCDTEGVLNTTVHMIASLQVTEALKVITKQKPSEDLVYMNIWNPTLIRMKVSKRKDCLVCNKKFEFLSGKKKAEVVKMCGANLFQIKNKNIRLDEVEKKLSALGKVRKGNHCVFFKELVIFKDRVLIKAKSEKEAKSLVDRYVA